MPCIMQTLLQLGFATCFIQAAVDSVFGWQVSRIHANVGAVAEDMQADCLFSQQMYILGCSLNTLKAPGTLCSLTAQHHAAQCPSS